MKRIWMVGVLAFLMMGGCLSPQERADLQADAIELRNQITKATESLTATKALFDETMVKIKTGEIDVATGTAALSELTAQMNGYRDQIRDGQDLYGRLKERLQGKSGTEILESLFYLVVTAVTGGGLGWATTRAQRGPSSRMHKNPDGSMRS